MKSPTQSAFAPNEASNRGAAEESLRLIARLSAPEGLEERVKAGLHAAPQRGRVLHWPGALRSRGGWMHGTLARSAAAAAIVCVVVGGGWGVYSRVQPAQTPKAVAMPPRVAAPGGFSSAGAMRTPQTLDGPVLAHRMTAAPRQVNLAANAPGLGAQKPRKNGKAQGAKELRKGSSE